MTEDAGSVIVTVETLRGTPARNVIVTLQTIDSSARGEAHKVAQVNVKSNFQDAVYLSW